MAGVDLLRSVVGVAGKQGILNTNADGSVSSYLHASHRQAQPSGSACPVLVPRGILAAQGDIGILIHQLVLPRERTGMLSRALARGAVPGAAHVGIVDICPANGTEGILAGVEVECRGSIRRRAGICRVGVPVRAGASLAAVASD